MSMIFARTKILPFLRHPLLWLSMALGLFALLLTLVYWPALHGPYVFDDQLNITENPRVAIRDLSVRSILDAMLSNESGPFKRMLPALSFGLNHYFAGGFHDTFPFKLTNLVIHAINGLLLFTLCRQIWPRVIHQSTASNLQCNLSAGIVTLIWTLHPLQISTVAYVVQRMTSMSALFVLLGLCIFTAGRNRLARRQNFAWPMMWGGIVGGTLLGLICKENAILLPLFAAVIEFTLFERIPFARQISASPTLSQLPERIGESDKKRNLECNEYKTLTRTELRDLKKFYAVFLFFPIIAAAYYLFILHDITAGYVVRPFTFEQRIFTELRILWFYLYLIFIPVIDHMGLYHDDIALSQGLFDPISTFFALLAWSIVVFLAIYQRRQWPVFSFAALWYLVGHSLESTVIPLELVMEHRNYVAGIGPILFFAVTLFKLMDGLPRYGGNNFIALSLMAIVIIVLSIASYRRAEYWQSNESLIVSEANNHPLSARSQYLLGELRYKVQIDSSAAYPHYLNAAKLEPNEVGYLIMLNMMTYPKLVEQTKHENSDYFYLDTTRITQLLREKPISAWGYRGLDVAARCVKNNPICHTHIQPMRDWLNALLQNPWLHEDKRIYFTKILFDIEMAMRMHQQALETIIAARESRPDILPFYLMNAAVLTVLERFEEAMAIMQQAEEKFPSDADLKTATVKLQQEIARFRQTNPDSDVKP